MNADAFIQSLTDILFVLIFLLVLIRMVQRPRRANVDATLLFGAVAFIVAETWISHAFGAKPSGLVEVAITSLLMALPYLLLRLIDDYTGVPPRLLGAGAVGLVLSTAILAAYHGGTLPLPLTLLLVAYFAALSGYVVYAVVRAAQRASGVTMRRMRAVALGSACLGLVIVVAGIQAIFPHSPLWLWRPVSDVLALVCGVSYFVGFAPPGWLRRAWQEPDLRTFLGRAAALPRLPDTATIVRELEHGAASSLGVNHAVIGLWNALAGELEFEFGESRQPLVDAIARKAFATQTPVFATDAARENPGDAAIYRTHNVNSVLAVPIAAGGKRLGVLSLYAVRSPIFAEDDLKLVQLLADQAAVILESRALIDEAARVRAREEATRLKDDFLSAAAHDLKTPLTAVIAQAQLMERRARRDPAAPTDLRGIGRIVQDAQRLRHLVTELLDVGRVEQGKLLDKREEVDLVALVRSACDRQNQISPRHECRVELPEQLVGSFDPVRIAQLVDNLLENAVKYSPEGGPIEVRVWRERDVVRLTVTDRGIGIPGDDLAHLFDRFHRGANVDDRRFSGMGLGLFICRGIAEQHDGRLWACSPGPGHGSTFHVELPVRESAVEPVEMLRTDSLVLTPGEAT